MANEDRIEALRKRVHRDEESEKPMQVELPVKKLQRSRDRQSFYLDKTLVERMDTAYKQMKHDAFPKDFNKSDFLEAIIAFGIDHEREILQILTH